VRIGSRLAGEGTDLWSPQGSTRLKAKVFRGRRKLEVAEQLNQTTARRRRQTNSHEEFSSSLLTKHNQNRLWRPWRTVCRQASGKARCGRRARPTVGKRQTTDAPIKSGVAEASRPQPRPRCRGLEKPPPPTSPVDPATPALEPVHQSSDVCCCDRRSTTWPCNQRIPWQFRWRPAHQGMWEDQNRGSDPGSRHLQKAPPV